MNKKVLQVFFTLLVMIGVGAIGVFLLVNQEDDSSVDDSSAAVNVNSEQSLTCSNTFVERFVNGIQSDRFEPYQLPGDNTSSYIVGQGTLTGNESLALLTSPNEPDKLYINGHSTVRTFSGDFEARVDAQMITNEDEPTFESASWLVAYLNEDNRFGVGLQLDTGESEFRAIPEVNGFAQTNGAVWYSDVSQGSFNDKVYTLVIKRVGSTIELSYESNGQVVQLGTKTGIYQGDVRIAMYNLALDIEGRVSENVVSEFDNLEVSCPAESDVIITNSISCASERVFDTFNSFNSQFWQSHSYEADLYVDEDEFRIYKQNTFVSDGGEIAFRDLSFSSDADSETTRLNEVHGIETIQTYSGDFRIAVDVEARLDESDQFDKNGVWLAAINPDRFDERMAVGMGVQEYRRRSQALPELATFAQTQQNAYGGSQLVSTNNNQPTTLILERVGDTLTTIVTRGDIVEHSQQIQDVYTGDVQFVLYGIVRSGQPENSFITFDNFEISCPEWSNTNSLPIKGNSYQRIVQDVAQQSVSQEEALPECSPVDINFDSKLDLIDLSSFAIVIGSFCTPSNSANNSTCGSVDSNNDGAVDLIDLGSFALSFLDDSCSR